MSRVHEALRRAEKTPAVPASTVAAVTAAAIAIPTAPPASPPVFRDGRPAAVVTQPLQQLLASVKSLPYAPSPEALLIDPTRPHEAPTEEFRTLRTRLNHMQSLQPIHTVVVTSPSPAEGKSFVAVNLALAQAQLSGNLALLCDFDFRRPIVHSMLQIHRGPGATDFLLGKVPLHEAIYRVGETNLYVMPAGEAVINPLELLNLREVKDMLDKLPTIFNWVILDSPPLLFAADANLLSTLCHGTILVTRIGATTIDSVTRAMQSLCQNNMLGIVVNGARRGELYSKYSYYHSYQAPKEDAAGGKADPGAPPESAS